MRKEYLFGDYLLVVTDNGFWLEDVPNKEIVLDASTIENPSSQWVVGIMSKDTSKRDFYTEVNTAFSNQYFNAGIARKKLNEK